MEIFLKIEQSLAATGKSGQGLVGSGPGHWGQCGPRHVTNTQERIRKSK